MLVELTVENYAVVESVRIRFHKGFNLLTGETGSGKSIVVDALGLLFGGRASADAVRSGAERARISGIFEADDAGIRRILGGSGIEPEDGELLIQREVHSNGKSRAFINNRPVTISLLRELSARLGDIHGQHDQQRLFEEAAQREILDEFGATELPTKFGDQSSLPADVAALFVKWRETRSELSLLERKEQERLRLTDLWAFQKAEIEQAMPKAGEDASLERERKILANVTRLSAAAHEAFTALYEAPEAATAVLGVALKRVEELCRIEGSLRETLESLRAAHITINEAAHSLRDYLGRLEADPQRLEEVEARLAALERLKRKYGTTLDEVLGYLAQVTASLEESETAEDRARALRAELDQLSIEYESAAGRLSDARAAAGRAIEKKVEEELRSLAMERTRFCVVIEKADWSEHGADRIMFLVSPNLGEQPRPLDKVLSGGELSRLALALKSVSARPSGPVRPALVFDEVDAGIGGSVAEAVGRRLKRIAEEAQVLCVTHLAQIASFGDHHYVVEKRELGGRTVATVQELDRRQRIQEIGRMLAGQRLTPEALRHAEQMLETR